MTSSNDNKDSSLPHAASRLVLYTNLKGGGTRKQQSKSRGENQVERNRKEVDSEERGWACASGGSGSELAELSGPL